MANRIFILFSLILALGIAGAGFAVGGLYYKAHRPSSSVVVKGMAEQDAEADHAAWAIKFTAADNDLAAAQGKIESDRKKIVDYLMNNGVKQNEIELRLLDITDQAAAGYRDTTPADNRYTATQIIMVQSANLDAVEQAAKSITALMSEGVVISSEPNSAGPNYIFSKLNDIKPAMIAEASRNARAAAQQFAKDSGAVIGRIKSANQGQFIITAPIDDEGAREIKYRRKKVRLVSTIEYYLE